MLEHSRQHTGGTSHGSSQSRCNTEECCSRQRGLLLRYDMGHFVICSTSRYGGEIVYLSKPRFRSAIPLADFSVRGRHFQAHDLFSSRNQGILNSCKDKCRGSRIHQFFWTVAEKEWTVLALAASPAVAKLLIAFAVMREVLIS